MRSEAAASGKKLQLVKNRWVGDILHHPKNFTMSPDGVVNIPEYTPI